ncbi:MAG: diacylglycerol kinase family lipid kinase [Acidobacteria bacterium]|nr:diacylglycerol kinase family lipid kinase [Acidobacteriota bacterium]
MLTLRSPAVPGAAPGMKRGVLIYNPTAGQRDRRARMSRLIEEMRPRGVELVNAPTEGPRHATEIVRDFVQRGVDLVAACGGDGTISEAAWGLSGSEVPLAVLPGGTSNVLARELSIPLSIDRAQELLLSGIPRRVRLLTANDRPFLLWAGAGLDARIMGRMSPLLKRWFGRAGIFCTVAPEFFRYEFPRLEVVVDGVAHDATFAVICHASRYAGEWIIAPDASLEAEEMDAMLFSGRNRWKFFSLFQRMERGKSRHLQDGIARTVRGRTIEIRSLEPYPVEVQVDGDCVLETPILCRASDHEVSILVPAE